MEIGLESGMPTYSGGLGVLAGDTIRSAADLDVPMVAVSLIHRRGYFFQRLDAQGHQSEEPVAWSVDDFAELIDERATVDIEGRTVHVRAWKYRVTGESGHVVPVYLLDTDVSENQPWDRTLTDVLYGGDDHYRLCQEMVLGVGGFRLLRALGYTDIRRFHMNEGHAALLVLALGEEKLALRNQSDSISDELIEAIREQCVFTTHTPVPAGHDKFPVTLARQVLGDRWWGLLNACGVGETLNLTQVALRGSRYVNGEGVTGWSIGDRVEACLEPQSGMDASHATELYRKLEEKVLLCFYKEHERFVEMMRHTIAVNGAFFNTQRMVAPYLHNAYRLGQARMP